MKLKSTLKSKKKELDEIKSKIQQKKEELDEIKSKIQQKEQELSEIDNIISEKKDIIESLKNEVKGLKDFINSNLDEELQKFDYKVDITNCYIISLNSKKYIAIREFNKTLSDFYSLATGHICYENYTYYDVLDVNENNKFKYIYDYTYYHPTTRIRSLCTEYTDRPPEYEEHILKVYPELSIFTDNKVPNTYLKKIYYEINNLGNKKLLNQL